MHSGRMAAPPASAAIVIRLCGELAPPPSAHPIVRRLFRDDDVVHVALVEALRRHADEPRVLAELRNRARARVAHAGAQAAEQLVHRAFNGTAVRHAALDPLGASANTAGVRSARPIVGIDARATARNAREANDRVRAEPFDASELDWVVLWKVVDWGA